MIDLHTHILPGIDDGASNTEVALKMTETLYDQGVLAAVCTPHFDPTQITLENFASNRANALSQMTKSKIKLIPASEAVLHEYLFHYPDLSKLCIENTSYLLVEMPFENKWDCSVFEMLNRLITYYNIIPVIAHIERYPAINKHRKYLKQLVDLGCIIQANTSALIKKKTRKKIFSYMNKGMIDVLGSDCHDMLKRPPTMSVAFNLIKMKYGIRYCEIFDHNANCIVNGIELRKKKSYIIE